MKIRFLNSLGSKESADPFNAVRVIDAVAGETILLACARSGIILPAPCGGRQRCGKCRVQVLEGKVSGAVPDAEAWVCSCLAIPVSDISIADPGFTELGGTEVSDPAISSKSRHPPGRAALAIDIGTTTVSARLIDLDNSQALDTISELNDQRVFGADVMSRINAAMNGKTNELFKLINRQTERIITAFKVRWGISKIAKLSVAGNTVMLHLFLNVDPSGMGQFPFSPTFLEGRELMGNSLSLSVESITVLPSIAAFIGADILVALAVLDIMHIAGPSILVDIGTNGEMALYNRGTIFCCSTAAGPAFEGAEISCGMGGVKGAISAVEAATGQNGISFTTIGNVPPVGLCGSGLIDTIALMLKQEKIDETGHMNVKEFSLAEGVSITAADVRQFQLAKSAILSGIKILCKNAGVETKDIKNVFIAGGFGFFINRQNAVAAGIFPAEFLHLLSVCGNLSLKGAEECLTAKGFHARCKEIAKHCSVIDLASDPAFMDEFAENMLFNRS